MGQGSCRRGGRGAGGTDKNDKESQCAKSKTIGSKHERFSERHEVAKRSGIAARARDREDSGSEP